MFGIILTVLFVLFVLNVIKKGSNNRKAQNFPPGPLCLPWIGSAYVMGSQTRLHVTLTQLAKKWGPIYRLEVGPTPVVVITDPGIIRQAFESGTSPVLLRFASETLRQTDKRVSLIFAENTAHWAFVRKIMSPLTRNFSQGTSIQQVIIEEFTKLTDEMDKQVNKEVYLNSLFMYCTRNVFLRIVMRKSWSFNTDNKEEKELSSSMMETMESLNSIADFIPALDFLAKKSRKIAIDHCRVIEALIKREYQSRLDSRHSEETARDLLDILVLERQRNPAFTEDAMFLSLRNMIFAGSMTVSDALDWMILFLCLHPDMQEKCYEEIYGKLRGGTPTMDDLQSLPYLDGVLKEVFRLRPTAPLSLPHIAEQDCTIAGYYIPKDTVILQNLYGIGNWDKFFKNADQFDPERWQREPELSRNLLTFGYGPTACLGMPIAKQEFFIGAATILQRYKLRIGQSTPHPDTTGDFKITFNPKPWNTVISMR